MTNGSFTKSTILITREKLGKEKDLAVLMLNRNILAIRVESGTEAMIVLVTVSCKKKDDTPTPDPTPTPKPPVSANIFQTDYPKMITDQEISSHKKIAGSLLYQIGLGLRDDDPKIPYAAIFKFYYNIAIH